MNEKLKEYHELTDNERKSVREYKSWVKSDAPHEYRMSMIESCYRILKTLEINHLV